MKLNKFKLKFFVLFLFTIFSSSFLFAENMAKTGVVPVGQRELQKESYDIKKQLLVEQEYAAEKIQNAHLAGSWYPGNKVDLKKELDYYFSLAKNNFKIANGQGQDIVALIVPHAGYYFSGLCAASAYQAINGACGSEKNKPESRSFERIIIIGPSHTSAFTGIALPNYDKYRTVMGNVLVDKKAVSLLSANNNLFKVAQDLWKHEHSIEIQLPFLQYCFGNKDLGGRENLTGNLDVNFVANFFIVPLIVGNLKEKDFEAAAMAIGQLLEDGKKTLIVISSDFTHYGSQFGYTPAFEDVHKFDTMAINAIKNKSFAEFDIAVKKTGATICGKEPIKILLKLIQMGFMGHVEPILVSYYNSLQIQEARRVVKSREGELEKKGDRKSASAFKQEQIDVSMLTKQVNFEKMGQTKGSESCVSYASIIFKSSLTLKEEKILLKIARNAIKKKLFPEEKFDDSFELTENLKRKAGLFVTLRTRTKAKEGSLRGCIGTIFAQEPIYKAVQELAVSSAFRDSRFLPLDKKELENILIDITILTDPVPVKSYNDIVIGKHGIILEKTVSGQVASAVFLPQVPGEFGWGLAQTLDNLSQKAGLEKDAWRSDCRFKVFEGFEFSE